ncbi:protein phosphatase 2C [Bacillus toyonensis]|uniref:protein phosphatase 2C n=1 Tax=Bacillus toyonensis TaxID=155322 RepID=UPI003D1B5D48
MENMLKKLKKVMVVAVAGIMLSTGFATVAPNKAHAAHWADEQMKWAKSNGYITADMRDSLATRQDVWLIFTRYIKNSRGYDYNSARKFLMSRGISDGTRGTDLITRDEMMGMIYAKDTRRKAWNPSNGFGDARNFGINRFIYDGSRGNAFATRAEIITMIFNYDVYFYISWDEG